MRRLATTTFGWILVMALCAPPTVAGWTIDEERTISRAVEKSPVTFAAMLNRILDDVDDADIKADILLKAQRVLIRRYGLGEDSPLLTPTMTVAEARALKQSLQAEKGIVITPSATAVVEGDTVHLDIAVTPDLWLVGTATIKIQATEGTLTNVVIGEEAASADLTTPITGADRTVTVTVAYGRDLTETLDIDVRKKAVAISNP